MSLPRHRFHQYAVKLSSRFRGRINERVGMKRHTSFKIGGLAEVMAWPQGLSDLEAALGLARDMELPWRILGAGTNLLVKDGGLDEVVINMADAFTELEEPGEGGSPLVRLGSGLKLAKAVKQCQVQGLAGLEFAAGIPGSVGGAVIMNAGSMGSCMAELVEWVEWYRPGRQAERTGKKDLEFDYRRLSRPSDAVVVAAGIRLSEDEPKAIRERIVEGLKKRRQTQPLSYPSAGSVFKNPPEDYAGRLIEAAGMKGKRVGDAEVSLLHANFIINRGRARSRDVIALIRMIREEVEKKFKVELELEIEVIGKELV